MELLLWQGQPMWPSWPSQRFRPQFVFYNRVGLCATKMKTIDFILDGKFHLHTPKKEGFRTKSKVALKKKGALFGHSS